MTIDAFVEAISVSLSTGDPQPFLAYSSPLCGNCSVLADNLADAYADGGSIWN